EYALPYLRKIKEKYKEKVRFKVIGDGLYKNEELGIQGISWSKENELKELSDIDIGIMPLPNDEWAKGKCGLKGLQYMGLMIPTIMSPVGVNTEIIENGVDGFLAEEDHEWKEKLEKLIENPELREKMGKNAREKVNKKYSFDAQKKNYLNYFNELLNSNNKNEETKKVKKQEE
ncbi:MAG: glycosyltransferase, partial [Flavobacteriales bacterium]